MQSEGSLGNVGEPPVSLSHGGHGGPGDQKPWRGRGASALPRARQGHHEQTEAGKVAGRERPAKRPERGRVAVLAAHSTGEGGDVRPKRPPGGQATPGITRSWTARRERR